VIGQYPHVQPEEARAKAVAQLSELTDAKSADDLRTPKQRARRELRESARATLQAPKLGEYIALYIKLNRKPGRYWPELETMFERDVTPALGSDTLIASITPAQLQHLGFQPHIIERVLNHVSRAQGGLVGVYQRYEYLEDRKRALCAWGNHVESLVSDNKPAVNVIPLRA
jgi:hypothetical protein